MREVGEFTEGDIEKILKIVPLPDSISFSLPVSENIKKKIITEWKGPTESGVPYEASSSAIYKVRGLERPQVINAAKEVLFKRLTNDDYPSLELQYRDGTSIYLCKEDLHIESKHEPKYIKDLLKFIKGKGSREIKFEAIIYASPSEKKRLLQ